MRSLKIGIIDRGHFFFCPTYLRTPGVYACGCLHCEFWGYLFLTVFAASLAALEFYGSGISKSLSLFGDAWHVSGDGVSTGASLIAVALIRLTENERLAERIRSGAVILLTVFLSLSAGLIVTAAHQRYSAPYYEHPIVGDVMFAIAVAGLVGNILMFRMLKSLDLGHHHGDLAGGHDRQHGQGARLLRMANLWHIFSDALASVLVVCVALLAWLNPWAQWVVTLDLAGSCAIATLLVVQSIRIGGKAMLV